jgi:hypothetical protein
MSNYNGVIAPSIAVEFFVSSTWTAASSDDILEIYIRRGRQQYDSLNEAGTAGVIFNNLSGKYDPDNTSSVWSPNLKAGLQMRIRATWSATAYTIYQGFLETSSVNQGFYPTVTMNFVDGLGYIADATAPVLASLQFEETAATRVGRMLDYAGWPTGGARSLTGTVTLQKTVQGRSALTMINQAVNAIAGRFYISKSGVATLVPLANKFSRPTQLLFSDQNDANSVNYNGLVVDPGTYYVVNQAIVDRGAEARVSSTYNPSVTSYGIVSKTFDAPIKDSTNATNLALYESRQWADPATYAKQVDFSALYLNTLNPDFLNCEIGDQVSVKRLTYDNRSLSYNLVIEGMVHKITADDWRVTFHTSPINPYSITI